MFRANQAVFALGLWTAAIAHAQIPRDPVPSTPNAAVPITVPSAANPQTATQQQTGVYVTKQTEVEIPFSLRTGGAAESQPASVRVFVSWDKGKSWHFYDERKPEDTRFRFRAKQDGEFWFATQVMDRAGKPASSEPRSPQLRLIVDTQRPQLLIHTNVDSSGQVNLSWSAADATLRPASLKMEYQDASGTGGPWEMVNVGVAPSNTVTATGQTSFLPATSSRTINLRAEITDAAGNMAYFSQRVSLVPAKSKESGGLTYSPPPDPSAVPWANGKAPAATVGVAPESAIAAAPKLEPVEESVRIPNANEEPAAAGPGRLASTRVAEERLPEPEPAIQRLPTSDSSDIHGPAEPMPAPPMPAAPEIAPLPPSVMEQMPMPQPAEQIDAPTAARPRLTNTRRFSLDYDIQSVGPEGVSAVELWGTNDGGRSWSKWGTDPDHTSPFDVEVNHEAAYGFRIVVVGKNGLATSTPQAGDAADIWVGVDLTRPQAKLTGAAYGQGEAAGKLDITWQADDPNLGSRPVTLSIGDRPDGRFTPIATAIPNTGHFLWEYDPRSPRRIYLRLEVRDDAGNIGIDQLTEPIKVEGLEPKAQIRGITPVPAGRGAFRTPLFR
jgi:hypothetical protein